jgi:molybdopterin/thiamine biosynthesis adenylyltransferase
LQIILGKKAVQKLQEAKIFMIGAGAIGCELLKNYAMASFCTEGTLYITDPDIIENSNLNRQFLFREKHIRKPKSLTAAAVAV